MPEGFVIPGTKMTVPKWAVFAGLGGVVLILVLKPKAPAAEEPTASGDSSGLAAAEISQRFQEMMDYFNALLGQSGNLEGPGEPVIVTPPIDPGTGEGTEPPVYNPPYLPPVPVPGLPDENPPVVTPVTPIFGTPKDDDGSWGFNPPVTPPSEPGGSINPPPSPDQNTISGGNKFIFSRLGIPGAKWEKMKPADRRAAKAEFEAKKAARKAGQG